MSHKVVFGETFEMYRRYEKIFQAKLIRWEVVYDFKSYKFFPLLTCTDEGGNGPRKPFGPRSSLNILSQDENV